MGSGAVVHVYNEARRDLDIVALVPEAGAPAGSFVGVANVVGGTNYGVCFVRYDAAGNVLTRAPALSGCSGALPGSGTLDPLAGILYVVTQDAHGTRLLGVHTADGTLASAATLPGDTGQTPSALFYA